MKSASTYDADFFAWTQEQAELLRAGKLSDLDREHLLEEIESMGRSERAELENRLAVLLAHLLKWQFQPVLRSRSWQLTIKEQRRQIDRHLKRNPSLHNGIEGSLVEAYGDAILAAEKETGLESFPVDCPYSLEQVLSSDFLPG